MVAESKLAGTRDRILDAAASCVLAYGVDRVTLAEIARRVRLRVAPELHFIADRTLDASERLENLLRDTEPETPEEQGDEGES